MGIETIIAIGALAATAAGTGAQVAQSRDAARDSRDARRDQAYQSGRKQLALEESQKANDATASARSARLRQRAVLAGMSDKTIATSPLGLTQTQGTPAAAAPLLKSLGA